MSDNLKLKAELFLARHLPPLLKEHKNIDAALEALKKHYKEETSYDADFDDSLLVKYLKESPDSGKEFSDSVITTLNDQHKLMRIISEQISRHFFEMGFYAIAILLFTTVISFIFITFVLPSFAEMFAGFGMDLPGLTKNLFDYPLLFILASLAMISYPLISYSLAFKQFRHAAITRNKTTPLKLIAPGLNHLSAVLDDLLLALNLQLALCINSEKNISDELNIIKQNKNGALDKIDIQHISIAEKLNTVADEMHHVVNLYETDLLKSLSRIKTLTSLFILIFVGVFIGMLVIAMYLPIFRMGSVV